MSKGDRWTEAELQWLKDNYADKSVDLCAGLPGRTLWTITKRASYLNLSRPVGNRKGWNHIDEEKICQEYQRTGNMKLVARICRSSNGTVASVLKRHNIPLQVKLTKADPYREAIVLDYRRYDTSVSDIAKRYGLKKWVVTQSLIRWGEYDPSRSHVFRPCKSAYQCWVERYGQEEADKRNERYNAHRRRGARRGKSHHAYGKPPPKGAKHGRNGWYKEHHFRSLMEACYMIQLDALKIEWKPAEDIVIPYRFQDGDHTYHPDFLVGTQLIEVKPKKRQNDPIVLAKRVAAEIYCSERGWTYEMIEVAVDYEQLFAAYTSGLLRFGGTYKDRFLAKMNHHNGCVSVAGIPATRSILADPIASNASECNPLSVK